VVTSRITFTGVGQGSSPAHWVRRLAVPNGSGFTVGPDVLRRLAALPDQDRCRSDPEYDLVALTRLG
jgi:hypothetical protein